MKSFIERSLLAWELKKLARENKGEPLSIMDDAVFKAMLTSKSDDSREALRSLLSACTRRKVSTVQIVNNDISPFYYGAKHVKLDVNVTFNDGETANLEMQTSKANDDLLKRAEYYAAMLVAGQLPRGKKYSTIKRVYQIFFLNYTLFLDSGKFPRRYYYQEETEHERLSDTTEIIFYELPKLEYWFKDFQAGRIDVETLTNDEKWCIYMRYRHDKCARGLIESLCKKEEGIMHAEKAVNKVSRSYKRYVRKMSEIKAVMERASEIDYVRRTGLAEGREEASLAIARNLLAEGLTPEFIQKITGLPLDEIEKLK